MLVVRVYLKKPTQSLKELFSSFYNLFSSCFDVSKGNEILRYCTEKLLFDFKIFQEVCFKLFDIIFEDYNFIDSLLSSEISLFAGNKKLQH